MDIKERILALLDRKGMLTYHDLTRCIYVSHDGYLMMADRNYLILNKAINDLIKSKEIRMIKSSGFIYYAINRELYSYKRLALYMSIIRNDL